jgi:hypothetical protein
MDAPLWRACTDCAQPRRKLLKRLTIFLGEMHQSSAFFPENQGENHTTLENLAGAAFD